MLLDNGGHHKKSFSHFLLYFRCVDISLDLAEQYF